MTEPKPIIVSIAAQTDVGRVRQNNEDNFLVADLTRHTYHTATDDGAMDQSLASLTVGENGYLAAVSDGMGGALAGEVASHMAVQAVRTLMTEFQSAPEYAQLPFSEQFRLALEQANKLIHSRSQSSPEFAGMGATFTGLGFYQGEAYLAQVGDSRAYLIRGQHVAQATKDQSLVNQLIDAGYITEDQAQDHVYRNVILQALGAQPDTVVVVDRLALCRDDTILICSDGLSNKINGSTLAEIIPPAADLKEACRKLIDLANDRGGEDNITVVLCRFSGEGLPTRPDDPDVRLERVERHDTLPTDSLPGLSDIDFPASSTAFSPVRRLADLELSLTVPESDLTSPVNVDGLLNMLSVNHGIGRVTPVERNIVRILVTLLIVVILGAVTAVAWYLRIWRVKNPPAQEFPPSSITQMTSSKRFTKALALGGMDPLTV